MAQKAYFLAPNFDYAPDKLIRLGQIIYDLKAPQSATSQPLEPRPEIHYGYVDNWETEKIKCLKGSLGIWARVLAMILGIGGDIAANIDNEDSSLWKFKKLETFFIEPTPEYIEASMRVAAVENFVKENPDKSTFMVTGVKIARGAEVVQKKRRGGGGEASVGIDATMAGAPGSAGPKVSISTSTVNNVSFTGSSDFVFAYRLHKIYRRSTSGITIGKEYDKGALYEEGAQSPSSGEASEVSKSTASDGFAISGFHQKDFGLERPPPGFEAAIVRDEGGGEERDCVIISPVKKTP
jgi:hypothetical protein